MCETRRFYLELRKISYYPKGGDLLKMLYQRLQGGEMRKWYTH
jgi:hypothetical protein